MRVLFLFLLISFSISARTVKSFVYDIDNNPLGNVEIMNVNSGKIVYSDMAGAFAIEGNNADTVSFTLSGFVTTRLTIKNILNANDEIYLFNHLQQVLPEITVTPANMYDLYEKAVFNLKNRLIRNKRISYKCTRVEKEVNHGDERTLHLLFTAGLENINPKKSRIKYNNLLSKLDIMEGSHTSVIMKDNTLYDTNLFFGGVWSKMYKCKNSSMQISDTTFVIHDKYYGDAIIYTINKSDTTLMKIEYELKPDKKYRHRRTFKAKLMYSSYFAEFKKEEDGYFLSGKIINHDYSFLLGKSEREERIVSLCKISAIPDPLLDATLAIKLDTRQLYTMDNYPAAQSD